MGGWGDGRNATHEDTWTEEWRAKESRRVKIGIRLNILVLILMSWFALSVG